MTGSSVRTPEGEVPADLVVLGLGRGARKPARSRCRAGDRGSRGFRRRPPAAGVGAWGLGGRRLLPVGARGFRPARDEALGTVANKQGRVAGINISGGYATFPGVAGHGRDADLCNLEIGRTGLNQTRRRSTPASPPYRRDDRSTTTTAGYMPGAADVTVKLLAERGSGRVLGLQIVGAKGRPSGST